MGQSTSFSSTLLFTMTGISPKSQAQELSKFNWKHLIFAVIIFLPFCMSTYFCKHHWFIIQHNFRSSKFMPPPPSPSHLVLSQRKGIIHWFVWLLPSFSPESASKSTLKHMLLSTSESTSLSTLCQHHCQPQNLCHSHHHPHILLLLREKPLVRLIAATKTKKPDKVNVW